MKQDTCTIGYSCGEACINTSYECKTELAQQSAEAQLAGVYFGLTGAKALNATLKAEPAVAERYEQIKLRHPSLTKSEAIGLANWIGPNYRYINRALLGLEKPDSEPQPWAKPAGKAINKALAKLPKLNEQSLSEMAEAVANKELAKAKVAEFLESGKLYRGIRIAEPAEFLAKNGIVPGGQMSTDHLFATSFDSGLATFSGNVQFILQAKLDGSSRGRLIDDLKRSRFESEVLYPLGTKFAIENIEQKVPALGEAPKSFKSAKAKAAFAKLAELLAGRSEADLIEIGRQGLGDLADGLAKTDAERMAKLFERHTNYAYKIYGAEL